MSSLHDPVTKHFILADSEEQECTRTVVFAVFTARYEFTGHWSLSLDTGDPSVGHFLTCVEARKGGLSTTTISESGTTRCRYIMATSLPAMSAVIATHLVKVAFPRQTLHRSWNQLSLLLRMAKLLDQQRRRRRSMKLSTLPKAQARPHLSRQVILYC